MHLVDAFVVDDIAENSQFSSEKVGIFVSNNFLPIRPYAELVSMRRGVLRFQLCVHIHVRWFFIDQIARNGGLPAVRFP